MSSSCSTHRAPCNVTNLLPNIPYIASIIPPSLIPSVSSASRRYLSPHLHTMSPVQSSASLPSVSEDMSSSSAVVSPSPETHSCPYADCNKSFSKKYNLKAHLRLHTGEQPFECDRPDCRKKFKWRSSLSSHSVWHSRKDSAASSATAVTKPSTSSKPNSQKTPQLSNSQNTSSSASASSPSTRKKRPRSEMSGCSTETAQSARQDTSGASSTSRPRVKPKGYSAKKQRRNKSCGVGTTTGSGSTTVKSESAPKEEVETCETLFVDDGSFEMIPGSPVTSDGSFSEPGLDGDEFSCDILQPLLSRGDTLQLDTDTDVLFGYEEAGCGSLSGFDTRFEHLDLDNFGNLYLNRLESL